MISVNCGFGGSVITVTNAKSAPESEKFTLKIRSESGKLFTNGCHFPPKSTNFGTLVVPSYLLPVPSVVSSSDLSSFAFFHYSSFHPSLPLPTIGRGRQVSRKRGVHPATRIIAVPLDTHRRTARFPSWPTYRVSNARRSQLLNGLLR